MNECVTLDTTYVLVYLVEREMAGKETLFVITKHYVPIIRSGNDTRNIVFDVRREICQVDTATDLRKPIGQVTRPELPDRRRQPIWEDEKKLLATRKVLPV